MSTVTDDTATPSNNTLADEVHELQLEEAALERRTRSLELAGPLALVFSFFALAVGIGALVVALGNDSAGSSGSSAPPATTGPGMMGSTGSSSMMIGPGGHGRFNASMMAAAKRGTVYVQLGDYWADPAVSSVRAGKVTFIARNVGKIPHELMVERMPIAFNSPMHPNEDAAQGMIEDMGAGQGGRMTMHLSPGRYMLFCNAPGHYAAGQHTVFEVTKS